MLWVGSGRCEKFLRNFVARTFALIVRFRTILHIVSCRTEMVSNVAKRYNMHQYMSLESNSEDRLRSFGKITMRLHGTKVCINCTSSAVLYRLFWCNKMVPDAPKWYKTHQNMSLGSNGEDRVRSLPKILMRLHGMNFCISCTSSARYASSFV